MHNFIRTSVRVNIFGAIPLIALPTKCGGAFVATQRTNVLIIIFTLITRRSAWVINNGSPWRGEINMAPSPLPSGVPMVRRNQPRKGWMWWK